MGGSPFALSAVSPQKRPSQLLGQPHLPREHHEDVLHPAQAALKDPAYTPRLAQPALTMGPKGRGRGDLV